jgi:hypothetical protein
MSAVLSDIYEMLKNSFGNSIHYRLEHNTLADMLVIRITELEIVTELVHIFWGKFLSYFHALLSIFISFHCF